jgi:hypothetical protein
MCKLDVFQYLVGAKAGCNWYLCDVNIHPLTKKLKDAQSRSKTIVSKLKEKKGSIQVIKWEVVQTPMVMEVQF